MSIASWIGVYGIMAVLVVRLLASLGIMSTTHGAFVAQVSEWVGGL